jgi:hypothetical protein
MEDIQGEEDDIYKHRLTKEDQYKDRHEDLLADFERTERSVITGLKADSSVDLSWKEGKARRQLLQKEPCQSYPFEFCAVKPLRSLGMDRLLRDEVMMNMKGSGSEEGEDKDDSG